MLPNDVIAQTAPAGTIERWDHSTVAFFASHRDGSISDVMRVVTAIGSPVVVVLTVGAVCMFLVATGRWRPGHGWVLIPITLAGAGVSVSIAKSVLDRARPPVALQALGSDADGFGFPSGHATLTIAGYGLLAVLLCRRALRRRSRVIVWSVAAVAITTVGVSRVYLGAHWPTDIAAGWLLGASWLLAWLGVTSWSRRREDAAFMWSPQ